MSLRVVHMLFIVLATLLALSMSWWGFSQGGQGYLAFAIISLLLGVILFLYGIWFFRKLKRGRFS